MLTKLINWLFIPNTVAGVMNTFQKTIDSLEDVARHHIGKVEHYEDKIEDLLVKVDNHSSLITAHEAEADAAMKMVAKLNKTFGLD